MKIRRWVMVALAALTVGDVLEFDGEQTDRSSPASPVEASRVLK